ncbi:hypothetical protein QFC19_003688 [Naganishia cerealis]|uniref:Uncharacterized protein n=1 Tax=Naganishia cerealis TaxID=610337 RepID=A0ACC2W2G7_9TREE|nr:hypothetical protein QFC19_003688 [Naganishia cerealis]
MAVDLPTQMNGKDSLNGWDMLIAYNEDVLNTSLAERASEVPKLLTGLDPIPISDTGKTAPSSALCHAYSPLAIGVVDPITRKTVVRYTANIQLKTPRVSFDTSGFGSVGPALVLVFPVTGSLTEPGTSVPIPDDLSLTCCTPLLYVSGSTGTTTQPGQVVVFDPTQVSTQNITLDFTKPSLKFTAPKGSATDVVQYNIDIAPRMVNHFVQTGGLEYRLAGITNAIPNSTTGNTTLQPSSFIFTLDPGEPSATPAIPGALLTWISLVGSTSTPLHPDPRQSLLFSLGGMTPVSPLMPSSSASIILAHNTMWSFFFKVSA